jgi:hypothetical protein
MASRRAAKSRPSGHGGFVAGHRLGGERSAKGGRFEFVGRLVLGLGCDYSRRAARAAW